MIATAILKRALQAARKTLVDFVHRERLRAIYRRFSDLTMIPENLYIQNLKLIENFCSTNGCIVECGVWRGGMIGGMACLLGEGRPYILFDSFTGLPAAKEIDGPGALQWQSDIQSSGYHENCKAKRSFAEDAMRRAGIHHPILMEGWFDQTIPMFKAPRPIDVLRLDGDWFESTMICLTYLFDQVSPGGIIIIDDYLQWDGCARAVHDFLSKRSAPERIQIDEGVCFIRRIVS